MQKELIQETMGQEYHQFLGDLGQAICDKISGDEGIEALKELENKQYLLERIKQIIESVYDAKNQEVFSQHVEQIEQQRMLIIQQQNEIKNLARALETKSHRSFTDPDKEKEKYIEVHSQQHHNPELQKQNWQLNKRLIEQDQQSKMRMRQFGQTIKLIEREKQTSVNALNTQLSSAIEGIKLWQEKYKSIYQQKASLETALEQQLERHIQEQMITKELNLCKEELEHSIEKLTKMNKSLKEQTDRLEDRAIRLQKNKQSLEEQVKTYQEEIKILKKVNEEVNRAKQSKINQFNQSSSSFNQAEQLIQNLKQVESEQQKSEAEQRMRKVFQLEKKLERTKCIKNQLEVEFHEYKLSAEKRIFDLEQESNDSSIRHEKEVRVMKQTFIEEKQKIIETYETKLKNIQQTSQQRLNQKIRQLEQSLKSSENQHKSSKVELKDLETFMQEKQLHYNESVKELQKKNQQLKTYTKQLEKSMKEKNISSSDFLKEYSLKVESCEDEVIHYKKENEKLRKQIDSQSKQLEKVNSLFFQEKNKEASTITQRRLNDYSRQDYEQYIKQIGELKQKILLMEASQKFISKDLSTKQSLITQLKSQNSKLEQKCQKSKDQQNKLQKELTSSRKQLTELQTSHHKELSQIYKANQNRIEQEKKQITAHYEELLKNREERLDECRNSTVLYDKQLTINNLRHNIETLRDKNVGLEEKIQLITKEVKQLNKEISLKENKLQQASEQISQMNQLLYQSKQQKLQMQKNIRQKLKTNQSIFAEFKHEVDAYLRKQLGQIRELANGVMKMISEMSKWFNEMKDKFSIQFYRQISIYQSEVSQKINGIKKHYEHEVNVSHKIEIQEIRQEFSQKLKQKQVESMAEIAQRQYLLKQLEKEFVNVKQTKEKLQYLLKSREVQLKKTKDEFRTIKQVNERMTDKTTKIQRVLIESQRDISALTKENTQLQQQLVEIQHKYQQKIDQTRQKYIQQNEKLFYKYEKEFDKLITMNSKVKNTAFSSMMLSSVAPTKEYETAQNETINILKANNSSNKEHNILQKTIDRSKQPHLQKKQSSSKLDSIKKEILLQKKKLQMLDTTSKNKVPTKGSNTTSSAANLIKHKKYLD